MREINARYVACTGCDALWARPALSPGQQLRCPRCGSLILKQRIDSPERSLALLASSLLLLALVGFFPFLRMEASGLENEISIVEAISVLWNSGFSLLSVAVALLVLALPLSRVLLSIAIAWHTLRRRPMALPTRRILALNQSIAPWAMAEIFMLGVVVSMVKVGMLADIQLGGAFWALAGFLVAMGFGFSAMCTDTLWAASRADA